MLFQKTIKFLIIHCSDTPDNQDISARDIHLMHLSFGWNGIGYHKIINKSGLIENGRPEYWIGAHTKGVNEESLGVCLIGRREFSNEQFNSLQIVLKLWKQNYPSSQIIGHNKVIETTKTCPNFDVELWCKTNNLK